MGARLKSWTILVVAALLLVGCQNNGGGDDGGNPGTVTPEGTVYTVESGDLKGTTLEVPAGTFDEDVKIEIRSGSFEDFEGFDEFEGAPVGNVIEITTDPEDPVFNGPVELWVPFNSVLLPEGTLPEDIVIVKHNDDGSFETLIPEEISGTRALVTLTSFSSLAPFTLLTNVDAMRSSPAPTAPTRTARTRSRSRSP